MALKRYARVTKGLKLKVKKGLRANSNVYGSNRVKTVTGEFSPRPILNRAKDVAC